MIELAAVEPFPTSVCLGPVKRFVPRIFGFCLFKVLREVVFVGASGSGLNFTSLSVLLFDWFLCSRPNCSSGINSSQLSG